MSWYPPFVEISFNVSRIRREEEYCYNCKDGLIRFHSRGSQFFFFPSKVSTGFAVEVEKLTDNKTRIWKCIAIDEHSRQFDPFAERFPFLLDSEGNWILSPLSYPFSWSFRKKKNSNLTLTISRSIGKQYLTNLEISNFGAIIEHFKFSI